MLLYFSIDVVSVDRFTFLTRRAFPVLCTLVLSKEELYGIFTCPQIRTLHITIYTVMM